ncbi:MAG: radical SAM protein [Planctomycetota bacterium]
MRRTQVAVAPAALRERAERARATLSRCTLCELRCGADRLRGEPAPCGLGAETWSFKRHLSFAEELELLPSYMVYLDGCNMRCRFCVQGPTCFSPTAGEPVDPATLARELNDAAQAGARSINLLGGEPGLHVHTILAVAAAAPGPLPLVLNSNMYMTPLVLELLDGVVGTYLADFKFGNDECARELAGIDRYVEVVTRNLRIADRQGDLIVRHLLMPGHLDCCLEPVAEWVARHLPDARFSLMEGYVPAWRTVGRGDALGRTVSAAELARARGVVARLGLREASPPCEAPAEPPGAAPGRDPVVTIRIDRDGRLLLHDLPRDMLPVAAALCPGDAALERRRAFAGKRQETTT